MALAAADPQPHRRPGRTAASGRAAVGAERVLAVFGVLPHGLPPHLARQHHRPVPVAAVLPAVHGDRARRPSSTTGRAGSTACPTCSSSCPASSRPRPCGWRWGSRPTRCSGYIKWNMGYHAMLATPMTCATCCVGHFLAVAAHLTTATAIFMAVAALFGGFRSGGAVFCLPIAVLTGLAFTDADLRVHGHGRRATTASTSCSAGSSRR